MIRYVTAGESHGKALVAILEGIPAGLSIAEEEINAELVRRQKGYGRGPRSISIERDGVQILSGIRAGKTLGTPIALLIENKDWEKELRPPVTAPRPGHADLAGVLKYGFEDIRNVWERSSARETAARVAVGAVCKKLLSQFRVDLLSWVEQIGSVECPPVDLSVWVDQVAEWKDKVEASPVRCPEDSASRSMVLAIEKAAQEGDTLGGVYAVAAVGCPPGLGNYSQWDFRLDARLGYVLLSLPAHKGIEIGEGFSSSKKRGSQAHDEIFYNSQRGFYRITNRSGGLEGGLTNGEPIVVHCAVKPLSSLQKPLRSVDLNTKEPVPAPVVRSDVCSVASACVIGEAQMAIVLAQALKEKLGGDTLEEMIVHWKNYLERLQPKEVVG